MVTRIYANAVAKYNDGKLLDREKLNRLIDAEFSDAVKILCDYGYGGGTVDEKSYDIDAFISKETASLIDYVFSSAPDEYLARVLTNVFLYGNAKAYYKARISGRNVKSAVYEMPDEELKSAVSRNDYSALPESMADALSYLDALFAEGVPDPKIIDIKLTQARFADSLHCARKSKDKSLVKYVVSEIDLNNIMSALRARAVKMGESAFAELIIDGGKLDVDDIMTIFRSEDPIKEIRDTEYGFTVEGCEEIDLPQTEARIDDFLSEIWERGADNMQSLSPFIGYFIAQLREYKTVKMILTCLKNGVREAIFPRLRKGE